MFRKMTPTRISSMYSRLLLRTHFVLRYIIKNIIIKMATRIIMMASAVIRMLLKLSEKSELSGTMTKSQVK